MSNTTYFRSYKSCIATSQNMFHSKHQHLPQTHGTMDVRVFANTSLTRGFRGWVWVGFGQTQN